MAKKLKLNLDDLTIKSFTTALDQDEQKDVKGGTVMFCVITMTCGDNAACSALGGCGATIYQGCQQTYMNPDTCME